MSQKQYPNYYQQHHPQQPYSQQQTQPLYTQPQHYYPQQSLPPQQNYYSQLPPQTTPAYSHQQPQVYNTSPSTISSASLGSRYAHYTPPTPTPARNMPTHTPHTIPTSHTPVPLTNSSTRTNPQSPTRRPLPVPSGNP